MTILEVQGWTWGPPGGAPLWSDVAWRLEAGERQVLVGPSGCGKSSFMRCLIGLESPRAGSLSLRGQPVTGHAFLPLRKQVAYVPQRPVAIAGTIAEELAFARALAPSTTVDHQHALLVQLGLDGLPLGRRFDALSGGEQQRLCLVRSLSLMPQVLLLDETTASLDAVSERAVEAAIHAYLDQDPGRAAVWISHRESQIARLGARRVDVSSWRPQ